MDPKKTPALKPRIHLRFRRKCRIIDHSDEEFFMFSKKLFRGQEQALPPPEVSLDIHPFSILCNSDGSFCIIAFGFRVSDPTRAFVLLSVRKIFKSEVFSPKRRCCQDLISYLRMNLSFFKISIICFKRQHVLHFFEMNVMHKCCGAFFCNFQATPPLRFAQH